MKKYNYPGVASLTVLILFSLISIFSAKAESPYSKFAYGLLRDNATSAQQQMGGVGYAMASGRQINVMNPASYAAIDTLTFLFDMGLNFSGIHSKEAGKSTTNYGGGLDYITMQFPVSKKLGMSFGLLPYSSVGYAFGSKIDNGNVTRQGNGGLNLLYLGAGWEPFKGARIGMNFSYFFGTTYNDVFVLDSAQSTASASEQEFSLFEQVMQVRDFHMDFGAQYTFSPAPRHKITAGVTFSPGKTLLGNMWVVKYSKYTQGTNNKAVADTVLHEKLKNQFSIPFTWGAGINYEFDRRFIGEVDFTYQPWSKAKYKNVDNFIGTSLSNRWKVGAGVQWTPDPRGSYFRRVAYRFGSYYNKEYIAVNSNTVRDYGVSAGFGFPAVTGKTIINLGLGYMRRQSTSKQLLSENYYSVTLGINFNERWFMKSQLR